MMDDYYAFDRTVRLGRYPGEVVSTHPSHWEAVQAMFALNEANDYYERIEPPREEYPDNGPTS